MERLTEMNENKTVHFYPECFEKCGGVGYSKKCDSCDLLDRVCDKLGEYEDLEEQGKLLKLPCAVGDRIYRIDTDDAIKNKKIEIFDIDNIVFLSDGAILLKYDAHDGVICELENIITDKPYLDFYRCFLTIDNAEAVLKEI